MTQPAKARATYADVIAAPPHLVAEVIGGRLSTSPRPAPRHADAASVLGMDLVGQASPVGKPCGEALWGSERCGTSAVGQVGAGCAMRRLAELEGLSPRRDVDLEAALSERVAQRALLVWFAVNQKDAPDVAHRAHIGE